MKNENVSRVMNLLGKHFGSRERTTLNRMRKKPDAFKILISCLLSLRTQDSNTEKASRRLFAVTKTPKSISALPLKTIEKLIFSSGHYRKKAKTIKEVSGIILKKYKGKVPDNKEELLSIRGIGPKTANIVLSFAYGQEVLPIDTHCHRIPNRIGWVKTKNPEQTEKKLEKILEKKYWKEFNATFVLFGKTICKPISPLCSRCPVERFCKKIGVEKHR